MGIIDASDSLEIAAPVLLEALAQAFQCQWGTFWIVDSGLSALRPIATWCSPKIKAENLEKDTKSQSLSLSEGTAGHVWRSRKPVWTVDLHKDMCIPRSIDLLIPKVSARELVKELAQEPVRSEEQIRQFQRITGLSRRTFYNYRRRLSGDWKDGVVNSEPVESSREDALRVVVPAEDELVSSCTD